MASDDYGGPVDVLSVDPDLDALLVRGVASPAFETYVLKSAADEATRRPTLFTIFEPQGRGRPADLPWQSYLDIIRTACHSENDLVKVACWEEAEAEKCWQAVEARELDTIVVPVVTGPCSSPNLQAAGPWDILYAATIRAVDLETDIGRRTVLNAIRDAVSSPERLYKLTSVILTRASAPAQQGMYALLETEEYKRDMLDQIRAYARQRASQAR